MAREAPVGNVAIIPPGLNPCLGQRTLLIRCNKAKVDPAYVSYLLNGPQVQATIYGMTNGATVPHLNMKDVRTLPIPEIPPLSTQRKIAAILSAYDDLIQNNTRRISILEEMAQMIYREWFVNFRFPGHEKVRMVESEMGPIPKGWSVERLDGLAFVTMGQSPPSEHYNSTGEGLPFHQGVADFGTRFPVDRTYCTLLSRIAEGGDILMSVRAPVGRLNITLKKIVIGRGLCAIRSMFDRQSLLFQQLKEKFHEEDSMGSGTIFKAVTKEDVCGMKFLQPEAEIGGKFAELMRPIFRQLEVLAKKNTNLRTTRDLLLPKLVSGEVLVENLEVAATA